MKRAHRNELAELAVTATALFKRRIGKPLHRFGHLPALYAFIFVDWHIPRVPRILYIGSLNSA